MTAAPDATDTIAAWLEPFAPLLTRPTWRNALVLVAGAVLAPGRRTVSAVLRAAGRGRAPGLARYHRVLDGGRWSGLAVARSLLALPSSTPCRNRLVARELPTRLKTAHR